MGHQQRADDLVNGDRQDMYGEPVNNMGNIARAWSGVCGFTISPKQVALCLAAMKLVREGYRHQDDNLIDAIGYLEIAARVEKAGKW